MAVTLKLIAKKELTRVIVDSTVQEKAVAHPTDSKLLETARSKVVEAAKANGMELKQTYAKEGQLLGYKAGLRHSTFFAHARQFKRMRKVIKRQRTIVGTNWGQIPIVLMFRQLSGSLIISGLGARTKLFLWGHVGCRPGPFLCLLQACGLAGLIAKLAEIFGRNRLQNSDHPSVRLRSR